MSDLLSHWGRAKAQIRDNRIVAVTPALDDPDPSRISENYVGTLDGDLRITRPMIRRGYLTGDEGRGRGNDAFHAVSWDEAIAAAARALKTTITKHGNTAVFGGSYGWASAGRFHHALSQLHRFLNLCGGYTLSVNTHSFAAAEVVLPHMLGSQTGLTSGQTPWELITGHTELFVAFGGLPRRNAQVAGGGVSRHIVAQNLRAAAASGTHFVNISPLRDDADDDLGAEWIAPRMNTDVALMLGLAHVLQSEGLANQTFLARYTEGYEVFRLYLIGESDGVVKDCHWASAICGLPADQIRALARRMASQRTMISMSFALQRADHGEQAVWMTLTLAAMLGQIGLPGGGFGLGYSAAAQIGSIQLDFSWAALPQGKNPINSFIPVARLVDMLENPGAAFAYDGQDLRYPDTKLIWWAGGNPFHHQQDTGRLARAWRKPDCVIVHEPFWNAHARHADIILPCTLAPERNDIGLIRGEPHMMAMKQMVAPPADVLSDHEIFRRLAREMGVEQAFTEGRSEMDWLRHLYEASAKTASEHGYNLPDFDQFWQTGEHRLERLPPPKALLEDFIAAPDQFPLPTPSGKIELYSKRVASFGYDDCPGYAHWFEPAEWLGRAEAGELHLISNQPSRKLHSQLDHGPYCQDLKIAQREPLRLHPDEAAMRGLCEGDVVELRSKRGACLAGVILSDAVARGHVQMSTGAWYDPDAQGLDRHGNVNVLTLDKATSQLAQGPTAHTTLVRLQKWHDPLPEVMVFRPPQIIGPD